MRGVRSRSLLFTTTILTGIAVLPQAAIAATANTNNFAIVSTQTTENSTANAALATPTNTAGQTVAANQASAQTTPASTPATTAAPDQGIVVTGSV